MEAYPKPQGVIFVGSPKTYTRLIEQKEREREKERRSRGRTFSDNGPCHDPYRR